VESAAVDLAVQAERAPRVPLQEPAQPVRARERGAAAGLAGRVGNRGLSRIVARMHDGEGIRESGVVHPDVEAAIGLAHGGGRPLDGGAAGRLGTAMGDPLADVRVHDGPEAAMLARAVSARAFTVGSDIFFGAGEYRPGTMDGDRLIAHETAHVIQQRGAPASGPLLVSQPGDELEREAEALARDVAR
jgi:hypothetical protein